MLRNLGRTSCFLALAHFPILTSISPKNHEYTSPCRYYDQKIGRMIQADSLIPNLKNALSLNRYAYVHNNPLKYADPSGHAPEDPQEKPFAKMHNQFVEKFQNLRQSFDQFRSNVGSFSNQLVMSRIAVPSTAAYRNSGPWVARRLQRVIGDQATLMAYKVEERITVKDPLRFSNFSAPYWVLFAYENPQAQNEGPAHLSWQQLKETFELSTQVEDDLPLQILLKGMDQKLRNNYGGGVTGGFRDGQISISVLTGDHPMAPGHETDEVARVPSISLMHELSHARRMLLAQNNGKKYKMSHNTVLEDLLGNYDEIIKEENIAREAYNSNLHLDNSPRDPREPIGERAHHWNRNIPELQKFLFIDVPLRIKVSP